MKKTMMNKEKWELAEKLNAPTYIDRETLIEEFGDDGGISEETKFLYLALNDPDDERNVYEVVYRFTTNKKTEIIPLELYDINLWTRV